LNEGGFCGKKEAGKQPFREASITIPLGSPSGTSKRDKKEVEEERKTLSTEKEGITPKVLPSLIDFFNAHEFDNTGIGSKGEGRKGEEKKKKGASYGRKITEKGRGEGGRFKIGSPAGCLGYHVFIVSIKET